LQRLEDDKNKIAGLESELKYLREETKQLASRKIISASDEYKRV
jgi:hypothetical protein